MHNTHNKSFTALVPQDPAQSVPTGQLRGDSLFRLTHRLARACSSGLGDLA
jgi:hypothetical protein